MVSNRNVTIKGVFAADASTTIPAIPVAGASYRDTTLTGTAIREGWAYKTIVDSSEFNEAMYEYSTITSLIEKYGFLPWSSLTNYETGSLCLGSNGVIYQAKQNTGPSSTAKDPTTDSSNTYWEDFVGSTYVTLGTNQTISGTKTFSSTISGSITGNAGTVTNGVYTTGNQTISGTKTFNTVNGIQTTVSGSNNIIQNNTAVSIMDSSRQSTSVNGYTVYDKDSRVAGMFGTLFNTDGSVQSFMRVVRWNSTTQSLQPANITVKVDSDENITTSAPIPDATDNSSQIATTSMVQSWANTSNANCLAQWSKGESGYFKFKNGLIIQWGKLSVGSGGTITYPTAFSSSSSYSISLTPNYTTTGVTMSFENTSSTSTSYHCSRSDVSSKWIAIGY